MNEKEQEFNEEIVEIEDVTSEEDNSEGLSDETLVSTGETKVKKKQNIFFEWVLPIALAFAIALLIKQFLIFKVYIPSGSMIPTLNEGDHLFVSRVYNLDNIKRGDILVFYSEELNDTLIKRVIGLPGDNIEIKDGKVSVNGEEINQDYVKNEDQSYGEFNVPEGKYFFLGDNRPISFDSRKWNNPYIDGKDIKAKAQIKVYPFSDFGSIK
ncbi:signal peptidase I [Clostridium sp. LP20]|uniref:signal peptidase I n=1 Tax=Clostridium sp. LP20 TaxID=3418665 RepID=UPI003EE5AF46